MHASREWQQNYVHGPRLHQAEHAPAVSQTAEIETFRDKVVYHQFGKLGEGGEYRYCVICYISKKKDIIRMVTPNKFDDKEDFATVKLTIRQFREASRTIQLLDRQRQPESS